MEALTLVCCRGIGICFSSILAISVPEPGESATFGEAPSLARAITQISSVETATALRACGFSPFTDTDPGLRTGKEVMPLDLWALLNEASIRTKMNDTAKMQVAARIDPIVPRLIS